MTPSKVPAPSMVNGLVGDPRAVMNADINRSLSCQSVLATRNGMRLSEPNRVRPAKVTWVDGVTMRPDVNSIQPSSIVYATSPPNGNTRVVRSGGRPARAATAAAAIGGTSALASRTPSGGSSWISPVCRDPPDPSRGHSNR